MRKLLLFLLLAAPAWAEPPYVYTDFLFNKGMRPAAGLSAGDEPVDVVNALWDATGFMYPRNAFKRFNGTNRSLGQSPITGLYRYLRRSQVPFTTNAAFFLTAESTWIFQDSSVTDTGFAFKQEPIFTNRGTVSTTNGSAIVTGSNTRFLQSVVPRDVYFTPAVVDSATYFRVGGRSRIAVKLAITDDTLELQTNVDSTSSGATNWKLHPSFDVALKSFAGINNRVFFSDSTKPVWGWDGNIPRVGWIVDSGRVYANTTTLLRDGSKSWFDNQWKSYWTRFPNRIIEDRGGAAGTDSMIFSPWVPIIGNTDTSLNLKYDPRYGDAGAKYYIMALPVERMSTEQSITGTPNESLFTSSGIPSFNERVNILCAWPVSALITSGPGQGEVRVVSNWYKDSLFFRHDKFKTAPTTASKFVLIMNAPVFPKTILPYQDRLWYIGDATQPNRIYYSEPLEPENVGPFNFLDVFPRDGDQVTTAAAHNGQLLTYKNNSIARVVGDNPSNFVVLPFLENLGTPGINTAITFGQAAYFYDYRSGIYELTGSGLRRLSDPIKPLLDSIPSAAAKQAALTVFKDHLWFAYPAGAGQTKNNRLLTYNIRVENSWARHSFTRASTFAVWPLTGDSTRLTLGDPDSGTVYFYNDTARVDAGTSTLVKLTYKTGWRSFSDPEMRKQYRAFHLAFESDTITGAAADNDTLYVYKDFAAAAHDTVVFKREGQFSNYVAKDLNRLNLGRLFQLEFRVAPRTTFRFYSAREKWTNAGERQ